MKLQFATKICATLGLCTLVLGCLHRRGDDTPSAQDPCIPCHGGANEHFTEAPESAMPPHNLRGETARTARGNGAHQAHLLGSERARAVACSECHVVPTVVDAPGHLDDEYPAEVVFSGPAQAFEAVPQFDPVSGNCANTFCHGGYFVGGRPSGGSLTAPLWLDVSGEPSACDACHGLPPPDPHPPGDDCSECHGNIASNGTFGRPDLHVDGKVTFNLPRDEP